MAPKKPKPKPKPRPRTKAECARMCNSPWRYAPSATTKRAKAVFKPPQAPAPKAVRGD